VTHRLPEPDEAQPPDGAGAPVELDAERRRLAESAGDESNGRWRQWGPFVAARAWGTVREDYSAEGEAWTSFPHEQARSRVYRWNEDGLGAVCDRSQQLCLGLALWNGVDPILKERAFGLTGPQGNHGEDVKDCYWPVDATPTHSLLRWRYHYPQRAFPYDALVAENGRRGQDQPEYELLDTGAFDGDRFWVVELTYAKAAPDDIGLSIKVTNAGPDTATLHVLPQLWFRNTWAWGQPGKDDVPSITASTPGRLTARHVDLGELTLSYDATAGAQPLFCDNETNNPLLYGSPGRSTYPKDGINDHVVAGAPTVNPSGSGTKAAIWHQVTLAGGASAEVRVRLSAGDAAADLGPAFTQVVSDRQNEADAFWHNVSGMAQLDDEGRAITRQVLSGLLWSEQFYHYNVRTWLHGDPAAPAPPAQRLWGRNARWDHVDAHDVILMPDTWEYPWFAAWDLAFHTVALAHVDPGLAKAQLLLLEREWYQHPNGQLPAYEWAFDDVNPPVQAWAALRVFDLDGRRDVDFLARLFHKLLVNFTWWVNREDAPGDNIFTGGFLGLDNIGPIDRSHLPPGLQLEQADATAWMAVYCLGMLEIAVILAGQDPSYEELATMFFEHFALIAEAIEHHGLWDEQDGFFYDRVVLADGEREPVRARSFVGLMPLVATAILDDDIVQRLPMFSARLDVFLRKRPDLAHCVSRVDGTGRRLLAVVGPDQLPRLLARIVDPAEFWSGHGLRSLSKAHLDDPVRLDVGGVMASADYEPAESRSLLYGGNSNWRGPVWMPANLLLVHGLHTHAAFDDTEIEIPGGAGATVTASVVADRLSADVAALFRRGPDGQRPVNAGRPRLDEDPRWSDRLWFHEYFDGDTGAGLGAEHQTGWTAGVAELMLRRRPSSTPPSQPSPPSG
jgi:hypothetical protein